ncbi:MAG TPA: hypothetical protein VFU21_25660 [Kofleriaceae bacterium]|nr:hypothetical protein [Kofleriaceae bacterium]
MLTRARTLAAFLALTLVPVGCADREPEPTERWATTENTSVEIDWNQVNEAYRQADGPEDLERRLNEIYRGDEVISVAVHDVDDRVQEVTGFFDRNQSGKVDEGEKIFTIRRTITGEGKGEMQTTGHSAYAGYHSPVFGIFTGMLLGSMLSSAFMPGYRPVYGQPYVTSPGRAGELRTTRSARAATGPAARPKRSTSGRTYTPPRGGMRGGGRFGIRPRPRAHRPARLDG